MKNLREAVLTESPADRAKRIVEYRHGELHTNRDADEGVCDPIAPRCSTTRRSGGRKHTRSKEKRGTKVCPMCNIELTKCAHRPLPGRPKNTEPTAPAKAYIPAHLIQFLDESGLRLGDVLEAVLESPAVKCWKRHVPSMGNEKSVIVVGRDGEEREEQYTALHREEERRNGHRMGASLLLTDDFHDRRDNLGFLAHLAPTTSKRCDRLVPVRLLQAADKAGRANRDDSFRYGKYSRSRFLSWAIAFYETCAMIQQIINPNFEIGKTAILTSRGEVGAVKAVASSGCPWCTGVIDSAPMGLRRAARRDAEIRLENARILLKLNGRVRAPIPTLGET